MEHQRLQCLTKTDTKEATHVQLVTAILIALVIVFIWYKSRSKAAPRSPPAPPAPPWRSSPCTKLSWFRSLASKPKVVMMQHTTQYGEYFLTFMILSLAAGKIVGLGNPSAPLTPQDFKLVKAWRQMSVHSRDVFCPKMGSRYHEWAQEIETPLSIQSRHEISDIMLQTYTADQITGAMRARVDYLDELINQNWKASLATVDSTYVGVFVRKSRNRKEGNTTREELCRTLKTHKRIVLVGDDLKDPDPIISLPNWGRFVSMSWKEFNSANDLEVPLSQFLVLGALFKQGVRLLVGKWSGWLIAGLCLGFRVKVIGELSGASRAREFLNHFRCVDYFE